MNRKILVLTTLLTISGNSNAFYDGHKLAPLCTSENRGDNNICASYLMSIVDTVRTLEHWKLLIEKDFCIPANVTAGQLAKVFIKYMNKHSEDLDHRASSLAMNAFSHSFPCK